LQVGYSDKLPIHIYGNDGKLIHSITINDLRERMKELFKNKELKRMSVISLENIIEKPGVKYTPITQRLSYCKAIKRLHAVILFCTV